MVGAITVMKSGIIVAPIIFAIEFSTLPSGFLFSVSRSDSFIGQSETNSPPGPNLQRGFLSLSL